MTTLLIIFGIFIAIACVSAIFNKAVENHANELFSKRKKELESEYQRQFQKISNKEDDIKNIIEEKSKGFPFLAKAFSDYLYLYDLKDAQYLENKKHPAWTTAQKVRAHSDEKKRLEEINRILNCRLETIISFYPFLEDILGDPDSQAIQELIELRLRNQEVLPAEGNEEKLQQEEEFSKDEISRWINIEEFKKLSYVEKNQLALDRYLEKRTKSFWEIGRDYELYIGYCYEKDRSKVKYQGILQGINDLGRDLIVTHPDKTIEIIQCKNWSQHKTIHEKHIFQLYGSLIAFKIDNKKVSNEDVFGHFITSTCLSDRARAFAKALKIMVTENRKIDQFPRIKCNISTLNGEKIFHLPFDQKYDHTIIEPKKGEMYAWTIQEAVDKGFRRAFRFRGSF